MSHMTHFVKPTDIFFLTDKPQINPFSLCFRASKPTQIQTSMLAIWSIQVEVFGWPSPKDPPFICSTQRPCNNCRKSTSPPVPTICHQARPKTILSPRQTGIEYSIAAFRPVFSISRILLSLPECSDVMLNGSPFCPLHQP